MKIEIGQFIILVLVTFSCKGDLKSDLKFDSKTWKESGGESIMLETRRNMVVDLIDSEILLNKRESEINELIGQPTLLNNVKDTTLKHYAVYEKYGWDIDPEEMLLLEIKFDQKNISQAINLITTK